MQLRINEYIIDLEDTLVGIHYWIQTYKHRVPQFEIFEYVGRDRTRQVFFFKARSDRAIIMKRWQELVHDVDTFKPFLLDLKKVEARIE